MSEDGRVGVLSFGFGCVKVELMNFIFLLLWERTL